MYSENSTSKSLKFMTTIHIISMLIRHVKTNSKYKNINILSINVLSRDSVCIRNFNLVFLHTLFRFNSSILLNNYSNTA